MKIIGSGYSENKLCHKRYLLEELSKVLPSLELSSSFNQGEDILILNLDEEIARTKLEYETPSDQTFIILIVHEIHRHTLPYLKMANLVVYTSDLQRQLCEDLIGLEYPHIVLPLPSGNFPLPKSDAKSSIIYFEQPFLPSEKHIYQSVAENSPSWYLQNPPDEVQFWFEIVNGQESDFEQLKETLEGIHEKIKVVKANDHTRDELHQTLQNCLYADHFKLQIGIDEWKNNLAEKRENLLYDYCSDSAILADFQYAKINMVRAHSVSSYNALNNITSTYKDWANQIQKFIDTQYNQFLNQRNHTHDNTPIDTLDDLNIVAGVPLTNQFVFSICFRNQEEKITRCLNSILSQNKKLDFGIAIISDESSDNSVEVIQEVLTPAKVDYCLVSNIQRKRASRNFYNVAHLLVNNDESVIIEVDGDDFLANNEVLETLKKYYDQGAIKTNGSHSMYPDEQNFSSEETLKLSHAAMDYSRPWNLGLCNAWLHLRTCKRKILKQVEIDHFLERRTKQWLADRHDSAIQPRIIELTQGKSVFVPEVLYRYDVSGDQHDHQNDAQNDEAIRVFHSLDRFYHPFSALTE